MVFVCGGERRRQHPGFEVGAEQPLGDQGDVEAERLAPRHHLERELERLVGGAISAARFDLTDARLPWRARARIVCGSGVHIPKRMD